MTIQENIPLAGLAAFRTGGPARFFCVARTPDELQEAVVFAKKKSLPAFILGGGSNILVSDKGFDGLVIKIEIKGIEELAHESANAPRRAEVFFAHGAERPSEKELVRDGKGHTEGNQNDVFIKAGAGEDWDAFVRWAVERGYGGLENLSLIPGTVGAAPVQNIGAYGAEVASSIESVEAFDLQENAFRTFKKEECGFAYRDSMFKREKAMPAGRQGRYAICSVLFRLSKDAKPNISYKDVQKYFDGKPFPSIQEVRDAVVAIRTAKLPDIRKVGTAGSYFKNPVLPKADFQKLKGRYPALLGWDEPDGRVKVPAAWIIDNVCGLKGKRFGRAGIHDTQALVIVNHGGAISADVEKVSSEVKRAVKEKTGIELEEEVVLV